MNTQDLIAQECDSIKSLLLAKNAAYGDSALDPLRIFSRSDALEQINVRIDDKLSRLKRGKDTDKVPEDTVRDLVGYLILRLVAERRQGGVEAAPSVERKWHNPDGLSNDQIGVKDGWRLLEVGEVRARLVRLVPELGIEAWDQIGKWHYPAFGESKYATYRTKAPLGWYLNK